MAKHSFVPRSLGGGAPPRHPDVVIESRAVQSPGFPELRQAFVSPASGPVRVVLVEFLTACGRDGRICALRALSGERRALG